MTSRSLPRTEKTPSQAPGRNLRTQSAEKKLVSAPAQKFTRRQVPKKLPPKGIPLVVESEKKKSGFSQIKKKQIINSEKPVETLLPPITKEPLLVADPAAPLIKPLKRERITMVTSVRAMVIAVVVSVMVLTLFGLFSLRIGKNDAQGFYAVNTLAYTFSEPKRFDLVQITSTSGEKILAVVLALPDEMVYETSEGVFIQLPNNTGFSLDSFVRGNALRFAPLTIEGKRTVLQNHMHYVVPLGATTGQFVTREAINGRILWE